ncbi:uncharacterized protein LOC142238858 [Haematobia irritans]|uniref:uncharacterized protein LOC142238858 n=1 Tax=Haematobia irritans TaxID=7368 RepID=UPI003F5064F0
MANITLCNIIAYISAILTCLAGAYFCFVLTVNVKNLNQLINRPDGSVLVTTESDVALSAIDAISYVALFVASVLLIIGIKKKHHPFVSPWVFIVGISVVLNLLKLIPNQSTLLQSLISVAIQVAIWYPIFSLYRELRKNPSNSGTDYNACPVADGEAYPQTPLTDVEAQSDDTNDMKEEKQKD